VEGTIVARGTEQSPIEFLSAQLVKGTGDWRGTYIDSMYIYQTGVSGFHFLNAAQATKFDADENYLEGNILEHVNIEYGGLSGSTVVATILANDKVPYLNHVSLRYGRGHGIQITSQISPGPSIFRNTHISDNAGGTGIYSSGTIYDIRLRGFVFTV
jgi:hypothetical protein